MVIGTKMPGDATISEPDTLKPAVELAMPDVAAVPVAAMDVTSTDAGGTALEDAIEDTLLEVTHMADVSRKTVVAPLDEELLLGSSVLVVALTTATGVGWIVLVVSWFRKDVVSTISVLASETVDVEVEVDDIVIVIRDWSGVDAEAD